MKLSAQDTIWVLENPLASEFLSSQYIKSSLNTEPLGLPLTERKEARFRAQSLTG